MNIRYYLMLLPLLIVACADQAVAESPIRQEIDRVCAQCSDRLAKQTGAYVLEYGEESLLSRAWLTTNAAETIDVQYFIWSTDNIGVLATAYLVRAAERGVRVRVLVDDLLIDAEDESVVLLNAHPNIEVRIYNPNHSVGVSTVRRIWNIITDFKGSNQRMHDKTAIFDGVVGITGGRNMADEYFDFNHTYNFRDRDILLMGKAVETMTRNFENFWFSPLSRPVEELLLDKANLIKPKQVRELVSFLDDYANDAANLAPVVQQSLAELPEKFPALMQLVRWNRVRFIHDQPGKNHQRFSLSGGGETTRVLFKLVTSAQRSITIQSPYLVVPDQLLDAFKELTAKGIRIRINTNSLASTDNLYAFSGYRKQRKKLLEAGVEIYEYKPYPAIRLDLIKRYPYLADQNPIFAIHAKSLVIDNKILYIGTFNLDPRSAHLNTEVGALIEDPEMAESLDRVISQDMESGNSWRVTPDFNPDKVVGLAKRARLRFYSMLPIKALL